MEVLFDTNEDIRKLAGIWNMFGPPNSLASGFKLHANFIGREFYESVKISEALNRIMADEKNYGKIWEFFLDEKGKDVRPTSEFVALGEMLENLKVPMEDQESKFFKDTKKQIREDIKVHEAAANTWMNKIFGFKLPSSIHIVLDYTPSVNNSQGSALSYSPFILSLKFEKYGKNIVSVVLHEILHSQIREHKSLKKMPENKAKGKHAFEEALLDYFAPDGILDEKIGLIHSLDLEKLQARRETNRPYTKEESSILAPAIKEYYAIAGKETIWSFLKRKGFKEIA